jgi:hypothetical protein
MEADLYFQHSYVWSIGGSFSRIFRSLSCSQSPSSCKTTLCLRSTGLKTRLLSSIISLDFMPFLLSILSISHLAASQYSPKAFLERPPTSPLIPQK